MSLIDPAKSLADWIAKVSADNAAANAAPREPYKPPPRWDTSQIEDQPGGGWPNRLSLEEACRFSKNGMAVGVLPHQAVSPALDRGMLDHFAGIAVAVGNAKALWVLDMKQPLKGRNVWDDGLYVWDTMSEHSRDYFEALHWAPLIPRSALEVLASAAE